MIKVQESKYGRGVFSTEDIPAGTIVETCPVILFPRLKNPKDKSPHKDVVLQLSRYTFYWHNDLDAIALGMGSLYNHAKYSNLNVHPDYESQCIVFVANQDIKSGEELFFNYSYSPSAYLNQIETATKISDTHLKQTTHLFEHKKESIKKDIAWIIERNQAKKIG